MKLFDIEHEVRDELLAEKKDLAKSKIRLRMREIQQARRVLERLESQYAELLATDIEDICEG